MSSTKLPRWTEVWRKFEASYTVRSNTLCKNGVQICILVVKRVDKINYALKKAKSHGTTYVCTNV
jgi:hypothetical protein